jgi:hypothetical protein
MRLPLDFLAPRLSVSLQFLVAKSSGFKPRGNHVATDELLDMLQQRRSTVLLSLNIHWWWSDSGCNDRTA